MFIKIYSSLNQIGFRPGMRRIAGRVVGNCVKGILIEDDHPKQSTTRISILNNENLFRKIQTGRRYASLSMFNRTYVFIFTWNIPFWYINHEWINIEFNHKCFVIIYCKLYCNRFGSFKASSSIKVKYLNKYHTQHSTSCRSYEG